LAGRTWRFEAGVIATSRARYALAIDPSRTARSVEQAIAMSD